MPLSRKSLFAILGMLVWIFLTWRLFPHIRDTFQNGESLLENLSFNLLAIAVLLIPINYGIEAIKWYYLVFRKTNNGYWPAYKSVLSGMALGILTPNRIGEPFARALMAPCGNYLTTAAAALICSFSQQAATLLFGILGMITIANKYNSTSANLLWFIGIGAILLALSLSLLLLSPSLLKWTANHHFTQRVKKSMANLELFTIKQVATVLVLSFIRYSIFLAQYIFVLYAFGCNLAILQAASAVACIFLVGSIIPLPAVIDIGVKISLAMLFLGSTRNNEEVAAAASTTIWIMNIAIPALTGTIFVISSPFIRKKQSI
ncbi:lysylphosphatidylglycerol synthase domain-containing protein [Williamwhitmania taraxaci]|uniref:Lysylphosphatidylglycerol synthase TM region n=1 Tax=Williamwhitmania taraxaci TaxID=1640674 RepID=A0A1G6PLY3_9BACT|nr:lysylphosphatidylglycerol synthase domain-containing protein [Williamwhitmania taraxaci]SDC81048.1 Lysylphosphatidylglycerol synthase TM region [Williamwhitmania taraxaci]